MHLESPSDSGPSASHLALCKPVARPLRQVLEQRRPLDKLHHDGEMVQREPHLPASLIGQRGDYTQSTGKRDFQRKLEDRSLLGKIGHCCPIYQLSMALISLDARPATVVDLQKQGGDQILCILVHTTIGCCRFLIGSSWGSPKAWKSALSFNASGSSIFSWVGRSEYYLQESGYARVSQPPVNQNLSFHTFVDLRKALIQHWNRPTLHFVALYCHAR
jgi:hypothetical protein